MAILVSDAAFRRRLKKSPKVDSCDLWKELHQVASFLALIGATGDALELWKFMYSRSFPLPDPEDRTIDVFGDGAISAVCYRLGWEDISKGTPAPCFAGHQQRTRLSGDLATRVIALDQICRGRITSDAWTEGEWMNEPKPFSRATTKLRKARILAQPGTKKSQSKREQESLSLLEDLIADAPLIDALHPYHKAEALVLAADLAVRHNQPADAIRYLERWHDGSIDWDYCVGEAFGLTSVAGLICEGVLASRHSLSAKIRQDSVRELIQQVTVRLKQPAPAVEPIWKHQLSVSYGQFYLEPLKVDPDAVYFQVDEESEQGFSSFRHQVAFAVPGSTDECQVEAEFADKLPPLKNAVQAVSVPLVVKTGSLYLRTVDDSGKKHRLDVPKGNYDVVARLFPRKTKLKDSCLTSCRVVLTFLPRGTVGPKTLKSQMGQPSREIFLNN